MPKLRVAKFIFYFKTYTKKLLNTNLNLIPKRHKSVKSRLNAAVATYMRWEIWVK